MRGSDQGQSLIEIHNSDFVVQTFGSFGMTREETQPVTCAISLKNYKQTTNTDLMSLQISGLFNKG